MDHGTFSIYLYLKISFFFVIILFVGCTDSSFQNDDAVLIRVENQVATIGEFKQAFELSKAAYSPSILRKPEILERTLYDVLYQLTDELVLMNRAGELNLVVTDEELDRHIRSIKSDYPDDTFDRMLIEESVSFISWEKGLKTRLLMEMVIKNDLEDRQNISSDDISTYLAAKKHGPDDRHGGAGAMDETADGVIFKLRREKAQETYQTWINELRNRYTIYVDQKLWERMKP